MDVTLDLGLKWPVTVLHCKDKSMSVFIPEKYLLEALSNQYSATSLIQELMTELHEIRQWLIIHQEVRVVRWVYLENLLEECMMNAALLHHANRLNIFLSLLTPKDRHQFHRDPVSSLYEQKYLFRLRPPRDLTA